MRWGVFWFGAEHGLGCRPGGCCFLDPSDGDGWVAAVESGAVLGELGAARCEGLPELLFVCGAGLVLVDRPVLSLGEVTEICRETTAAELLVKELVDGSVMTSSRKNSTGGWAMPCW
jgi:hypothetical protein